MVKNVHAGSLIQVVELKDPLATANIPLGLDRSLLSGSKFGKMRISISIGHASNILTE